MNKVRNFKKVPLVAAISALAGLQGGNVLAQEERPAAEAFRPQPVDAQQQIEEVVVQARLQGSATALINERLEEDSVSDVMGAEMIGRVGDTTVAAALRRVSGLSLVNNKFVYVRGLGERYSSTTLNGAEVPSPDLSRNVLPLDIVPTSVVESLSVQKSYSADRAASFGGGSIDIRTRSIPDDLTYSAELSSGTNFGNQSDYLTYNGGDKDWKGIDDGTRALSSDLKRALNRFGGDLSAVNIRDTLLKEGRQDATFEQATRINQRLATALNRNVSVEEESTSPDYGLKGSVGNRFVITEDLDMGFLLAGSYKQQWRDGESFSQDFGNPEEQYGSERESQASVDASVNLNVGVQYTDDHTVNLVAMLLRNTDDETSVKDYHNENNLSSEGQGLREYQFKYEQREMQVSQLFGSHLAGDATRELLPAGLAALLPQELQLDWYYSESEARTDIPNQLKVGANTNTDTATGAVLDSTVRLQTGVADFRFTDLNDEVLNYGWDLSLPLATEMSELALSGGIDVYEKARTFEQLQFTLGALSVSDPDILSGPLDGVFSDENITSAENQFVFDRSGSNSQSYIAAAYTNAAYGQADWTYGSTWRLTAGARWEEYGHATMGWDPIDNSINNVVAFEEEKVYPSVSLTYMSDLWAETFQMRVAYSETAVRPDLREIFDSIYEDPRTGWAVQGNSSVTPADVNNYDVRGEWFFDSGDNVTLSAFLKDISNPIEFFEAAASDTNRLMEIVNTESAEVYGVELEGMKDLSFLGSAFEPFFVQGNLTWQESEIVAGEQADAPTNTVRPMAGASDFVANMMLGFDSPNGGHSAMLVYNVFGERLYAAGRNGSPDSYEQPFHSLDLTYSWYPMEEVTFKLKLQNILDEKVEIEQSGVKVYSETPGQVASLTVNWSF